MAFTKKMREEVYAKYGGRCAYCGERIDLKDMQIDHFVPIARNYPDKWLQGPRGTDDISNLMPSCRACNFRKGMCNIEQFRENLEHGLVCCNRDFTYRMMVRYGLIEERPHQIVFYFEKEK